MDTVHNVPTSVVPDVKHTPRQDNIYHITTTYQARTIFDRPQHSAYQYLERRKTQSVPISIAMKISPGLRMKMLDYKASTISGLQTVHLIKLS